ncbi:hypothetical protein SAMN06264348_102215 [Oceanospirillum linum]|nr:hypothetical protein SAMN04489856_105214 [Oleiphilus messinensis]SMP10972.1 hypothetical protein SAMN06264348_102215 [Oceanospirillum linum]
MRTRPSGHIWMAAEQFYNAAEKVWNSDDIDLAAYVYPLVVNYAFSCELSLKASEGKVKFSEVSSEGLLFATNIESAVRGHDLKSIFTKLKLETQEGIKSEFESATGENLIPLLEECSRYFEDGRYSFEKIGGSYSLSGVRTLAKGLLDAVMAFGKNHA